MVVICHLLEFILIVATIGVIYDSFFYKNRNLLVEYKNNMNECKDYYSKENQYSKFSLLIKSKIK